MKAKDIEPGWYAVSIPSDPRRAQSAKITVRGCVKRVEGRKSIVDIPEQPTGSANRWNATFRERPNVEVVNVNILAPWDDYQYEKDYRDAHRENGQRDCMAEQDREWAERTDKFDREIAPAFMGLLVEPTGAANFDRDNIDLSEELRRIFIEGRAVGSSFGLDIFQAIALRIQELSDIVAQNALTEADLPQAGWGLNPTEED